MLDLVLKSVQVLQSLFLLHLREQYRVLDLQDIEHVGKSLQASDGVSEDNGGVISVTLKVVEEIGVLVFNLASMVELIEPLWHFEFICQINVLGLFRTESKPLE
jgi:hypothetical protein